MEDAHNKSDETLAKPSGGLPDYVKPSEQEEGERLAKDVFDRDKNIIESSDDDEDDSYSEDDQIGGFVQWRGRKKRGSDISTITSSDFIKPKEEKPQDTEASAYSIQFPEPPLPRMHIDVSRRETYHQAQRHLHG